MGAVSRRVRFQAGTEHGDRVRYQRLPTDPYRRLRTGSRWVNPTSVTYSIDESDLVQYDPAKPGAPFTNADVLADQGGSFWSSLLKNIAEGECTPIIGPDLTSDLLPHLSEVAETLAEEGVIQRVPPLSTSQVQGRFVYWEMAGAEPPPHVAREK